MKTTSATPLLEALKSIEFWLTRENAARVIVATAQEKDLQKQNLPDHVRVTSRPLRGKRVAIRAARNLHQTNRTLARWPKDQMNENTSPCLLCVSSGQADIFVGDYILHCAPGDFVLIPAGVPKGDYLSNIADKNPRRSCDIVYLSPGHLLGKGLECWLSSSRGTQPIERENRNGALVKDSFIAVLFDQLNDEMVNGKDIGIILHIIRTLILCLQRAIHEGRVFKPHLSSLHQPVERGQDPIQYAISYIDSHLDKPLTISLVARQVALSPTSFKKLFRQTTGVTFHDHLTSKRIDFASSLLRDTDLKISRIGEYVGLKYFQLSKYFHHYYGCSPNEYRKCQLKSDHSK